MPPICLNRRLHQEGQQGALELISVNPLHFRRIPSVRLALRITWKKVASTVPGNQPEDKQGRKQVIVRSKGGRKRELKRHSKVAARASQRENQNCPPYV